MKAKWRIGNHYGKSITDKIFVRGNEYKIRKKANGRIEALAENGKWTPVNSKAFWLDGAPKEIWEES